MTALDIASQNCRSLARYVCSKWLKRKRAHTFQSCTRREKVGEIYLLGSFMPPHFHQSSFIGQGAGSPSLPSFIMWSQPHPMVYGILPKGGSGVRTWHPQAQCLGHERHAGAGPQFRLPCRSGSSEGMPKTWNGSSTIWKVDRTLEKNLRRHTSLCPIQVSRSMTKG